MINYYVGTPGSGKSYHLLEDLIAHLEKGGYVIANFALNFPPAMVRKGFIDRFMFVPDEVLMGARGVNLLFNTSLEKGWPEDSKIPEGHCMVILDEAGNYFRPDEGSTPLQKLWVKFFRMHRKLKFNINLVSQGEQDISRTIRSNVEYVIKHRCANSVFPFKLLPFKIFMYVTYWNRQKVSTGSSILVKRFANLYNTHQLFGMIDQDMDKILDMATEDELAYEARFGNLAVSDLDRQKAAAADKERYVPKNYADFVTMTEDEYERLVAQLGEKKALEMIESLNLWKGSKGRKTNSDYFTILSWVLKEKKTKTG